MVCYTKKHHIAFEIDDEDFPIVLAHTWHISYYGYVATHVNGIAVTLHKLIMNTPTGMDTDHVNGNKLDNTKFNLRICTRSQNNCNQKPQIGRTSQYKGVCWFKWTSKWRAYIMINKKRIHLGYFKNEEEAAIAYNVAAVELYGEYARLNII